MRFECIFLLHCINLNFFPIEIAPNMNPYLSLSGGGMVGDLRRRGQGGEELFEEKGEAIMIALLKP